ncbi:MAG TPA: tetratricopeptide repeat protein [Candidatus Eisenbacteria bacterium]|nr:tetratricopeptide repeat protein [Candidatus Eisenbacteria bacterium]
MRRLVSRALLLAGLGAALAGCGDGPEQAALYRAERLYYQARKEESQIRLGTPEPDSSSLLSLRASYLKVRSAIPTAPRVEGTAREKERALAMIRTVGSAEVAGVRLALEARRADLALETAVRLQSEAAADTATARQAAFMAVAAYQGLRRYDDAVAQMKLIMKTFPPSTPPTGGEDPVLSIPEAIVSLRRNLGDEAAAQKELREGLDYYESLLSRPRPPELEAQIRARILRTNLELNQIGRALDEANALERLVVATPALRPMLAEIAFAKGKIKATIEKDPSEGIAILDRIATDFPGSPLAPRALFEAASQAEAKGQFEGAKFRYEGLLQRYPGSQPSAPMALYRLGLVQEKMGDWSNAKATLESVPLRYPQSAAAAEAPVAVIQHYIRENRRTAAQLYFSKALETYRTLVQRDSTGQAAPLFRVKMFQIYAAKGDSLGVYAVVDEMLRNDPKHPYTAQVLLEGARAANRFGNPTRSAAYLRRFLKEFPKSPLSDSVRRELKALGG